MSDKGKSNRKADAEQPAQYVSDLSFVRRTLVRWGVRCIGVGLLTDMAVSVYIMVVGSSSDRLMLLLTGVPPIAAGLLLFRFAVVTLVSKSKDELKVGRKGASMKAQSTFETADRAQELEQSVSTNTGNLLITSAVDTD